MGKEQILNHLKAARISLSKHSPEILMGIGITGMITTTVLAVKATPKALYLVEERKEELEVDVLPPVEVVKSTWKCYIPAAVTCTVSVACLLGANAVNGKRNAALAAAYKLSESAFSDYRNKTLEVVGDKKERNIRDKISEDQLKNTPVTKTDIIVTGKGSTLCFEPLSARYFYSDLEKIKRAENNLNKEMLCDPFDEGITVNEWYDEIGLPHTSTGDGMGWKLSTGMIDIYPSAQMADEDSEHEGEPCIVLNYTNPPQYNF